VLRTPVLAHGAARRAHWGAFVLRTPVFALGAAHRAHLRCFLPAAGLVAGFGTSASFSGLAGWSPRTRVNGQTENAGHFLQPTAIAIGQMVMGIDSEVGV